MIAGWSSVKVERVRLSLWLLLLLIVLVGDEMGDLFVQEEFNFTAELLDGVFDLVR